MDKKNLIKKVEFREKKDIRHVEAGGDKKKIPKWIKKEYSEEKLLNLKQKIEVISKTTKNEFEEFPIIVEANLHEKATSKTAKLYIQEIFKNENFLGVRGNDKILYKLPKEKVKKISKEIEQSNYIERIVVSLKDLKKYELKIEKNLENAKKIRIKLIDQKNEALNLKQEKILMNTLKSFKLEIGKKFNNSLIYEIFNNGNFQEIKNLENLPFLESVEEIIEINLKNDFGFFRNPSIFEYKPSENTITVGLFDSGVNKALFEEWCLEESSNYIEEDIDRQHGTNVGSILAYGPIFNENHLGIEGVKFISCVIGNKIVDETQLIIVLEENLKKYSDKIKIWNLSLGSDKEIFDDKFSDLAIQLDILQKKYNVLFIKTTGNCTKMKNTKINRGAESLRSLTIGSISPGEQSWSPKGKLSSFSKVGPGLANVVKPDLVYYGGDVSNKDFCGMKILTKDGKRVKNVGTSLAVPAITSYAAQILNKLDGEFDPILLKGLIIHNASYNQVNVNEENIRDKYGFGVPININEIFYEDDKQITLLFRGKITKGKYIESLDLPYPKSLIKDGIYTGEITVTALIDPILDGSQGLEYCQTDLNVSFGVYEEKVRRDLSKRTIKNEIGTKGKINILNKSFSRKKISGNTEKSLKLKGKYTPIKKYIIDLEKFTDSTRTKLTENKKWFISLEPQYQLALSEKLKETKKKDIEIDYCVLVTIKSDKNAINNEMNRLLQLSEYNPVDIQLNINENIENELIENINY